MLEEILCGDDCESDLPIVAFNNCAPEINKSEITAVYMALTTEPDFVNEGDLAEWKAKLLAGTVRKLTVISDKPAPTESSYAASNNRNIIVDRARILNVTIDETNDTNYDLMRHSECGLGLRAKFWYVHDGYLYGGVSGLRNGIGRQNPVLKLSEQLDRGNESVAVFAGTIAWGNLKSEKRILSPFTSTSIPIPPDPSVNSYANNYVNSGYVS